MINIIEILMIYGLVGIALYLNSKNEVLKLENKGLRDRIKRANEWFEYERKFIKESAILGEQLRVSNEQFKKTCEEFQEQCEEYHKQCEEINKKYEVK